MRFFFTSFFITLFSFTSFSQNKEWVDSKDFIAKGMTFIYNKEYDRAINEFNKVSPNDTNYALARFELVLSYFEQEKDEEVIKICQDALSLKMKWDHLFRQYLIESMNRLKKEEIFEQIVLAQKKYPFNEDFILLEAVANEKWERYDESIKILQKLILQNPFNRNAHYYLGKILADQGDFVRATISLEAFLMMSSSSTAKTGSAIIFLSDIFSNKYDVKIKNAKKDPLFKEVEELIESELALKKAYKTDAPLDDPIVRQTDILLKNIEYKKGANDFWMDFYVPFLIKVKSQGMIRGYTYQFLSFIEHEAVQIGVKKYKTEIDKYIKFAADYFDEIRQKAPITINGESIISEKWYDDEILVSTGKKEGNKRTGTWYFFYPEGSLESIIYYDLSGKRNDTVYYYYPNGQLKDKYTYKNDIVQGNRIEYFENGEVKSELIYKDDSLHGLQKIYYANGAPKESIEFKKGRRHGINREFDNAGNQQSELHYTDGNLQGVQKGFYPGMILKTEADYKDGKREGSWTSYHKNGKLRSKGSYAKGKAVGKWEEYFSNGKPERLYVLNENGDYMDSLTTYYHNGQKESSTYFNKKGQKEGAVIYYTPEGKLFSLFTYKKDRLKAYKYFSADGKVLSEGSNSLSNYNEYGNLSSKGEIKKGKRIGRWEFYYPNGEISAIGTYSADGELDALYEAYYQSGEIKSKTYYSNGTYNGPFTSYHENKKVQTEGWYKNGEHAGEWNWYYINGNPEQKAYYINDEPEGFLEDWNTDSTLDYKRKYKDNLFQAIYYYGPDGTEETKLESKNGSGSFKYLGENKEFEYQRTYLYGVLHDKLTRTLVSKGLVLTEENYNHGYLNGKQIYRHLNGQVSLESDYAFGHKNGTWKYYDENGTLKLLRHYSFGNLCDSSVWYYPSGRPKIKEYYNDMGQISGLTLWYYENGKIKKQAQCAYNKRDGWTSDYDPEGRLIFKRWYENGNIVLVKGLSANGKDTLSVNLYEKSDTLTFFYDNSNPALSARYEKGLLQGQLVKYFYDGRVMEKTGYLNDIENGESLDYYSNGNLMQKENYYMGESHGKQEFYYENGQLREEENQHLGNFHGENKVYNKNGLLIVHGEYRHGTLIKNYLK